MIDFFLRLLFFAIIASGIYLIFNLNQQYSVLVPASGGTLVEGMVGMPRFVNPALAITRADQDTVALLYSGLMKIDPEGNLVNNIAESVTISEDGLTYNIKVRKDQSFHDGTPLTAKDVAFTMELVKNPELRSPLRGNWNDVAIEQLNEYELNIVLKEPYSPFIENFTLGIMPSHIWSSLPVEQIPFSKWNTEPIGSGPFSVDSIKRNSSGLITGYDLKPTEEIKLDGVELKYYQNEEELVEAFKSKEINASAFLPASEISNLDKDDIQIISEPVPKIFGVFFNQNRSPALRDKNAREALNIAIDRDKIVNEVLGGYGVPTKEAVLIQQNSIESNDTNLTNSSTSSLSIAHDLLVKSGWTQNTAGFWEKEIDKSKETLSVTIKTSNSALFDKTATLIAEDWRKLGVEVQVEQYEQSGLVESVIRTRDFQALLFGLDMNRTEDLYPFWHSSQKDDPGLNISQYTNINVDRSLEKIRISKDDNEKRNAVAEINKIINQEVPAIFLFTPNMTYVIDKDITVTSMTKLDRPSDRFMNISNWYANTESLWPIFGKNN
ncbi:MAG: Oligopeptide-binding protein AppA precursor [Parcubacteria bacterium OLB19]|nr:MAG: Oligopeptide-binding protein AppA precursor [Parcubacteria bacterium OLB19]